MDRQFPGQDVSRRSFLKFSGLAAGAIALGASGGVGAADSSAPLKIALIGTGTQGRRNLKILNLPTVRVIALCDVDHSQLAGAQKALGAVVADARLYTDFRKLFEQESSLAGVVVATPDHWHAPLIRAALQAGKHIYCEKPLTHTVSEARQIAQMCESSKLITQMGNHGSAATSMRRSLELMQAGVLGQVREMHAWLNAGGKSHGQNLPAGEDPTPDGFDWDFWLGPAPARPYKKIIYHPERWRDWYDFGSGSLGDFGCHAFNLPMRALKLTSPDRIEVEGAGLAMDSSPVACKLRIHFPARAGLDPFTIHWYDGGQLPQESILRDVLAVYKKPPQAGCVFVGDKGVMYTNIWNMQGLIKLNGESRLTDVLHHPATQSVPITLPRVSSHQEEWVDACRGGPPTFSSFQVGCPLTEITLACVVAVRVGRNIEWDGQTMQVQADPDADKFIHSIPRKGWEL